MSQQEIIQLLDRYLAGTATVPEQERIDAWLTSNENLNNDWEQMDETQRADFLSNLYQKILATINDNGAKVYTIPPVATPRRRWIRWVAAACILLIVGFLTWLIVGVPANNRTPRPVAQTHDVAAPTETRAVITLANGSKVYLDSVDNGTIAQENNVNVVKTQDGKLIYDANSQQLTANSPVYNTLYNPRGSRVIDMTLSDGSHVWLNAGSSITYPVAFIGKERNVSMTGEAYFEIAHDAAHPFIVSKGETSVTVLGTHFNVNAYDDEEALKVTLLEGSVKVSASTAKTSASTAFIKPGQQAIINQANLGIKRIEVQTNVDLEEVMSWKNGTFSYTNTDLPTIMRQMARWYDVEVIYQDPIKDRYTVDVPRTVPVSQLFKFIEMSGGVHFKIEGKRITVTK